MQNIWDALAPALRVAAAVQAPAAYLRHLARGRAETLCTQWTGGSVSVAPGGPMPSHAQRLLDQWAEGWRPEIPHLIPMLAMGAFIHQYVDRHVRTEEHRRALLVAAISEYESAFLRRLMEIAFSTSTGNENR